jgi:aspartate kinase
MIVAKIGGSCLSGDKGIHRTTEIVKEWMRKKRKPLLVVSAFKGITDELLAQIEGSMKGDFTLKKIRQTYLQSIKGLSETRGLETKIYVELLLEELENDLKSVSMYQNLSIMDRDKIVVYGEKLATVIISAYLKDSGIESEPLWGCEAGIITNSNFGNASILKESISSMRVKLDVSFVPVVAGYFGHDRNGEIATLGRGASDYIATFISAALGTPVVLYKDVDGLMTADPKIVEEARIIKEISYLETMELAHFGTKVINKKAVVPSMKAGVPITITNFWEPFGGTTIHHIGEVNIISHVPEIIKLNLVSSENGFKMVPILFSELLASEVNPLLISKVSRSGISLVINKDEEMLLHRLLQKIDKIEIEKEANRSLVAAIGKKIKEKGVDEISNELNENKIKYYSLVKSATSKNLCVVVDKRCLESTIKLFHSIFVYDI